MLLQELQGEKDAIGAVPLIVCEWNGGKEN